MNINDVKIASFINIIVFLFHGATFSLPKEMTKLISKWNINLILCYIKLRDPRYSHEILVKFWQYMMVLCKLIDILYEGQKIMFLWFAWFYDYLALVFVCYFCFDILKNEILFKLYFNLFKLKMIMMIKWSIKTCHLCHTLILTMLLFFFFFSSYKEEDKKRKYSTKGGSFAHRIK